MPYLRIHTAIAEVYRRSILRPVGTLLSVITAEDLVTKAVMIKAVSMLIAIILSGSVHNDKT